MEMVIKAFAFSAVCAVIGLLLKKQNPEIAILIVIVSASAILMIAFGVFKDIYDYIKEISSYAEIEPAIVSVIIKTLGIGIVSKFSADVCKDANHGAVATSVELLGSVTAIYLALPLIKTVIKNSKVVYVCK